jgi:hypothetical protein
MRSWSRISAALAITAATLALAGSAAAATHSNPAMITINDGAKATPYPSTITVSGEIGVIADVNVTLTGFSHAFPADVGVLLVGPTGAKAELTVGAGTQAAVGLNLTFDDEAAGSLPCTGALATGTYKPTDCAPSEVTYPSPAPMGPYGELLSAFDGTAPNGTWSLFVADFVDAGAGAITGGWSITINQPLAVTMAGISARPAGNGVLVRWRTGSEFDFLGFHVYRAGGQVWRRLTRSLILARGGIAGASYRFLDRRARRGGTYRYRIQTINLDGSREWFGPVRVRVPR